MATIDEILGRKNKQSLNRQQMQQQVYNTPAVTPAAPASQRPLTEKELEQEQGKQGEVVQLGDAKPKTPATPQTAQTPETPSTPEKPAISPDATKATMPALQQPQLKGLEGVDTSPKDLKGWLRWYDEQKRRAGVKSDEELEKARKRDSFIAAIGDGISALAQIHYAGKGAVVNPGTGNTLSEGAAKRHERLRRERDTNENRLLGYLRERRNQELAEKRLRQQQEYQRQRAEETERTHKENEAIKREQLEIRKQVSDAQVNAAKARQAKDEAQAKYWDAYAAYRAQGMDDNHAKAMAEIEKKKQQTATETQRTQKEKEAVKTQRARTQKVNSGKSGGSKKLPKSNSGTTGRKLPRSK